jgi:hypothetical protein
VHLSRLVDSSSAPKPSSWPEKLLRFGRPNWSSGRILAVLLIFLLSNSRSAFAPLAD